MIKSFSLASISPLVSVRIYSRHEFSHEIANQLRSFCPALPSIFAPSFALSIRRVRHFRFPHYTNGRSFLFNNMRYYCYAPFVRHVCVCVRHGLGAWGAHKYFMKPYFDLCLRETCV